MSAKNSDDTQALSPDELIDRLLEHYASPKVQPRGGEPTTEGSSSAFSRSLPTIMGSAVAGLLIGPPALSARASRKFHRELRKLKEFTPHLSVDAPDPMDDDPDSDDEFHDWASFSVGTESLGAEPIDGRRLAALSRRLAELVQENGSVGAFLDAGRGLPATPERGPVGEVLESIQGQASCIIPGHLSISPRVQDILAPLGVVLEDAPGKRDTQGRPISLVAPSLPPAQLLNDQGTRSIRGWFLGAKAFFEGLALDIPTPQKARSGSLSPSRPSEIESPRQVKAPRVDGYKIAVTAPKGSFVYLLLERGEMLEALKDGQPCHRPGENPNLEASIPMARGLGPTRPLVLISASQIPSLKALVEETTGRNRPAKLFQRLKAGGNHEVIGIFEVGHL